MQRKKTTPFRNERSILIHLTLYDVRKVAALSIRCSLQHHGMWHSSMLRS